MAWRRRSNEFAIQQALAQTKWNGLLLSPSATNAIVSRVLTRFDLPPVRVLLSARCPRRRLGTWRWRPRPGGGMEFRILLYRSLGGRSPWNAGTLLHELAHHLHRGPAYVAASDWRAVPRRDSHGAQFLSAFLQIERVVAEALFTGDFA